MSRVKVIEIPEGIMNMIKEKYKQGASIAKLQADFNYPYHILQNRLKDINVAEYDRLSYNVGLIQRAENQMIGGRYPEYFFKIKLDDYKEIDKYQSLLHAFSRADLNNDHVNISEGLLR